MFALSLSYFRISVGGRTRTCTLGLQMSDVIPTTFPLLGQGSQRSMFALYLLSYSHKNRTSRQRTDRQLDLASEARLYLAWLGGLRTKAHPIVSCDTSPYSNRLRICGAINFNLLDLLDPHIRPWRFHFDVVLYNGEHLIGETADL